MNVDKRMTRFCFFNSEPCLKIDHLYKKMDHCAAQYIRGAASVAPPTPSGRSAVALRRLLHETHRHAIKARARDQG